ncbi:hypothetical protein F2P81_004174 [Scophthalmus maximus]|uniref:Uncharacterized protein n=1 Tax=Scophthalmus maximus TaxID=52904 RepID=A0A6A4T909_SCOMX|nr:hypothetical protein F2P81_004174 [Scophthalmus maximus]
MRATDESVAIFSSLSCALNHLIAERPNGWLRGSLVDYSCLPDGSLIQQQIIEQLFIELLCNVVQWDIGVKVCISQLKHI